MVNVGFFIQAGGRTKCVLPEEWCISCQGVLKRAVWASVVIFPSGGRGSCVRVAVVLGLRVTLCQPKGLSERCEW